MKFFDSPKLKTAMNKVLLVFIFYVVAAASFNGFFVKWAFLDDEIFFRNSFSHLYYETAHRPFVKRQFMLKVAKKINAAMSEETRQDFLKFLRETDERTEFLESENFIEVYYNNVRIKPQFAVEYHIVYFLTFIFLFLSMFLIREIAVETTGSSSVGTLTACVFAIIFPIFETVGGYFYDFGEIFFFSLSALLAIKGYWLALILISPIAEYNKESFLIFLVTLYPFLVAKFGKQKSFFTLAAAIFLSALVYLAVAKMYAENPGGAIEFHLLTHLVYIFEDWLDLEITYGVFFGAEMFLPHVLLVAWLVKCTWQKLSPLWQEHIKIAAALNIPLYILFCWPGELRNFSLLYIGFTAIISTFIKESITDEGKG